ncbi:hypothetical protein KOW79_014584 [Hemibagrus wyckioides]|uniref:Uncharacterized protein n=1 Tax=Hemibagrus wyckioides TaxID=337641 RepID=A0A9D3SET5_9TELE|nr:hypothetical protein KOW79_014584 [Hemibagrus wyckioides]
MPAACFAEDKSASFPRKTLGGRDLLTFSTPHYRRKTSPHPEHGFPQRVPDGSLMHMLTGEKEQSGCLDGTFCTLKTICMPTFCFSSANTVGLTEHDTVNLLVYRNCVTKLNEKDVT